MVGSLWVERPAGVEPASLAWEARVIPIYDGRTGRYSTIFSSPASVLPSNNEYTKPLHAVALRGFEVR